MVLTNYVTMVRPGLFLQREGPGSEPGNSLWHPEVSLEAGVLGAVSVERAYCINSMFGKPSHPQ